jgi:hypothetical protein
MEEYLSQKKLLKFKQSIFRTISFNFSSIKPFYLQDPPTGYCPPIKNIIFLKKWLDADNC